ncbi:hypothetical protein GCM10023339_40650 [Alloalcanivorax gelatiniphagus]
MTIATLIFVIGAVVFGIIIFGGVGLVYFLDQRRDDGPPLQRASAPQHDERPDEEHSISYSFRYE